VAGPWVPGSLQLAIIGSGRTGSEQGWDNRVRTRVGGGPNEGTLVAG
jgi:hypothetical protein